MTLSRALASTSLMLLFGCQPPALTQDLGVGAYVQPPKAEGMKCQNFANPFGRAVEIVAFNGVLNEGGHHLHLYKLKGLVAGPPEDCAAQFEFGNMVFATQSLGETVLTMPEGTGVPLAADEGLRVRIHALNPTDQPLTIANSIELRAVEAGTSKALTAPIFFGNLDITIPPNATTTLSKSCAVPKDAELVWLTTHMHAHGLEANVKLGDQLLYETKDWHDTKTRMLDPKVQIAGGQSLQFSCTYVNDTAEPIRFGDRLEHDEMCNMVGAYVAKDGSRDLLTCDGFIPVGEGTFGTNDCLGCSLAMRGAQARVCRDDGATSGQKLDAYQACQSAECGDKCPGTGRPSDACLACVDSKCAAVKAACLDDT